MSRISISDGDFEEVTSDLILYLTRKEYPFKEQEYVKLQVMYLIFKACKDQETLRSVNYFLDEKEIKTLKRRYEDAVRRD